MAKKRRAAKSGRRRGRPRGSTSSGELKRGPGRPRKLTGGATSSQLLSGMQTYFRELTARHAALEVQMSAIRDAIGAMGAVPSGGMIRKGPSTPSDFRSGSLKDYIIQLLSAARSPIRVKDITTGIINNGYHHRGQNLPNQVSMALAEMLKDGQVNKVGRGLYSNLA